MRHNQFNDSWTWSCHKASQQIQMVKINIISLWYRDDSSWITVGQCRPRLAWHTIRHGMVACAVLDKELSRYDTSYLNWDNKFPIPQVLSATSLNSGLYNLSIMVQKMAFKKIVYKLYNLTLGQC